jgi:hypothetical protein
MKADVITPLLGIGFWSLATISTTFYTFWAFKIHNGKTYYDCYGLKDKEKRPDPRLIGQRWFNFLGSISGWLILWILLPNLIQCFKYQATNDLSMKDIILFLIALIGVSGYLPLLLFGIAKSANELANKIGKQ